MPTYKEILHRLKPEKRKHLAVAIWAEDDVLGRAMELRIKISGEQARKIIDEMDRKQDCSLGITWDTIDYYLYEIKAGREI
ncbi:MAG: hypothetical protein PHN44_01260 [Candidatus Marinimicrobia bacterium]|nr:hypothetical protein [Candidatus Neomarinimicrobiota bacterium]MDD5539077.1 hypothetical protein [Candidatus Neomarinimicrobiota bacterium]